MNWTSGQSEDRKNSTNKILTQNSKLNMALIGEISILIASMRMVLVLSIMQDGILPKEGVCMQQLYGRKIERNPI